MIWAHNNDLGRGGAGQISKAPLGGPVTPPGGSGGPNTGHDSWPGAVGIAPIVGTKFGSKFQKVWSKVCHIGAMNIGPPEIPSAHLGRGSAAQIFKAPLGGPVTPI